MKRNTGKVDQTIRIIIGIVIISLGIYFKSWWGAIGLIPLITAALGFCPLYEPLKINTYKKEKDKS